MEGTRGEDARRRAELAQARSRAESAAAQELIDEFVARAEAAGLAPSPLRAKLLSRHEVRTDKTGWYIRRDRSLAVGVDGAFYVLTIAGGRAERARGARLQPSPPPLVVSPGGRDGESGDLRGFLDRALAGLD